MISTFTNETKTTQEQMLAFQRLQMLRYQSAILANTNVAKKSNSVNNNNNNVTNTSNNTTTTGQSDLKYKTELCKTFSQKGFCAYGNKCRFAHGKPELCGRPVDTKKYKQKECASFFTNGTCCYGSRCHFKHEERKITEISRQYYSLVLGNLASVFSSSNSEEMSANEISAIISAKGKTSVCASEDKFSYVRRVSIDTTHSDCNTSISSDDVSNNSNCASKLNGSRFSFAQASDVIKC